MVQNIYHHIYNRGAHKTDIFHDNDDYLRMLKLLYIANNTEPFVMKRLPREVFSIERKELLVDIVAYCLMPNHIHFAIKKRTVNGSGFKDQLTRFVHKVMTGYSLYYNKKYGHSGTIWQGPYKDKTVYDGLYIQTLVKYIHTNPCSLAQCSHSKKSDDKKKNPKSLEFAMNYEYSSWKDYRGMTRVQGSILTQSEIIRFDA